MRKSYVFPPLCTWSACQVNVLVTITVPETPNLVNLLDRVIHTYIPHIVNLLISVKVMLTLVFTIHI